MKIEKEKLEFLNIFRILSDNKSNLGDKIQIVVKKDKITFNQITQTVRLTKSMPISSKEEYELLIPIFELTGYLALDSNFEITKQGLIYDQEKEIYEFENLQLDFPDEVVNIEKGEQPEEITIKNILKSGIAKNFAGTDDVGAIALTHNHFVATDRLLCAIVKTDNNIDETVYFPKLILDLFDSYKIDELGFKIYKDCFTFEIAGVSILVPNQDYAIPEVFDENYINEYDHKDSVSIDKIYLERHLKKMMIASTNNPNNRIFFSIKNGDLILKSKDFKSSFTTVKTDEPNERLEGQEGIVSCNYFLKMVQNLPGSKTFIYMNPDLEDSATVKLEDENHDVKLLHILFQDTVD